MRANLAPPKNYDFPEAPKEKLRVILEVPKLEDLDLSAELYNQYVLAKQLLSDADDQPLNQKAQTLNSIVSILRDISKVRTDLFNAERIKAIESALLMTLKDFPEMSTAFLESYEAALARI